MSTTQGAFDNSSPGGFAPWSNGPSNSRWTPVELIAMVLGFMVFWPIGLAVLGYKVWQRKSGGPDLQSAATSAFSRARSAMGGWQGVAARSTWTQGFTSSTGNAAFDAWKSAELSRLEAERRRLEDAHREFADWLDSVRKAKDREEFDRFMSERRTKGA